MQHCSSICSSIVTAFDYQNNNITKLTYMQKRHKNSRFAQTFSMHNAYSWTRQVQGMKLTSYDNNVTLLKQLMTTGQQTNKISTAVLSQYTHCLWTRAVVAYIQECEALRWWDGGSTNWNAAQGSFENWLFVWLWLMVTWHYHMQHNSQCNMRSHNNPMQYRRHLKL